MLPTLLLLAATLLCSLTAGFLFAFTVVAMPGIGMLPDRDFLRAFKVMDRVIQDNNPLFMLVWVGSVLLLLAAAVLNFSTLNDLPRWLLVAASVLYVAGVQLPTVVVNIPLNNRLQAADLAELDDEALQQERTAFEARWVFWNAFRTGGATLATTMLLIVLTMGRV